MLLLAGDCGGTKTRVALYEASKTGKLERKIVERFDSKSASSLEEIIGRFLAQHKCASDVEAACFGVPGPVVNGHFKATNLPWTLLSQDDVAAKLGLKRFRLVNDLVATIAATPNISESDLFTLYPGKAEREKSVFAILAPGTGLGQAYMLIDSEGHYHCLPSEGGHVEFAPKTELEFDLLKYLQRKLKKRVSIERVLCGPGLVNIYNFLRDHGYSEEPPELKQEISVHDAAAVIAQTGISREYEICVKALDMFAILLGSQAGDIALTYLATGGIYLGGGIPPKIIPKLREGGLTEAYLKKGRLSGLVESTPLHVIKDDHAAVLGAATLAWRHANS